MAEKREEKGRAAKGMKREGGSKEEEREGEKLAE